jgi:hypothetical protein
VEFSEQVMTTLTRETAGRPGGYVVLIDSDDDRLTLQSAFRGLFPEAARLRLGAAGAAKSSRSRKKRSEPAI